MKPLSRRTYAIVAILLAAVIFIGLNIGADATFTTTRLDLTQNGQYTLAPGTKNILRHLKEPILLKFFYSKKTAAALWRMARRRSCSPAPGITMP